MEKFKILIHGGAGKIGSDMKDDLKKEYIEGLKEALYHAYEIMSKTNSSIESTSQAVILLEDNHLFNAGKGAVYTNNFIHELDSSIMNGKGECGACCNIKRVKNPILLAKAIMEKSDHVFLSGEGAEIFAKEQNLKMVENSYFDTELRLQQLKKALENNTFNLDHDQIKSNKSGTVGAVAINTKKELVAATSTGGMTNKKYGRVGDTSIIGAGCFASNKTCAISCTGVGEEFIRHSIAHTIHSLMLYAKLSLKEAVNTAIHQTLKPGDGGLIAIDNNYNHVMDFNSLGMFRGVIDQDKNIKIYIWDNEELIMDTFKN